MKISEMNFSDFLELFQEKMASKVAEVILEEREEIAEATFKKVNRIRGGKIQRRKKVSTRKGYTFKGGKMKRMTNVERKRRHLAQVKGARKRKAKIGRSNRKRKISMRKRSRLGS